MQSNMEVPVTIGFSREGTKDITSFFTVDSRYVDTFTAYYANHVVVMNFRVLENTPYDTQILSTTEYKPIATASTITAKVGAAATDSVGLVRASTVGSISYLGKPQADFKQHCTLVYLTDN